VPARLAAIAIVRRGHKSVRTVIQVRLNHDFLGKLPAQKAGMMSDSAGSCARWLARTGS
jgi:hypothetical protein